MSTVTAPAPAGTAGTDLDVSRAWGIGGPTGLGMIIVCAVGMAVTFNDRLVVDPVLSLGWTALMLLPAVAGYIAGHRPALEGVETAPPGPLDVVTGALTGAFAGGVLGVFGLALATIGDTLRDVLVNLSPQLLRMLTFEQEPAALWAIVVPVVLSTVVAAAAAAVRIAPERVRDGVTTAVSWVLAVSLFDALFRSSLDAIGLGSLLDVIYTRDSMTLTGAFIVVVVAAGLRVGLHGRGAAVRRSRIASARTVRGQVQLYALIVLAAVVLPFLLDRSVNDMLINVVIFGIMALGLNIVIGLTGMLDLGYVAFFAVGAYVTAVLTAPATLGLSFQPEISFWIALPISLVAAVLAGLLVGTPVIGLRGDYLAIVTLGFAAIAQRLVISDWFAPAIGGPQGVRQVPGVDLGIVSDINASTDPRGFLWVCLGFLALMIYVAWRLQHSRLGRAWQAIREDETVARAMGINVPAFKLMAFIVGAVFAALAGSLFAVKVSSAFPTSFELLVSVLVLVVVIVGGTGYVPGVLLGSLVLVGVLGGPTTQGLLAEFANFKLLIYGALLVVMMLVRPEGLVPRPDRSREIEQEEMDQDAWFDKNVGGSSAVAAGTATDGEEQA